MLTLSQIASEVVVVCVEGRSREGDRGGGGLCLEETLQGPSRDPSGALLVLVQFLSGALVGPFGGPVLVQSCGKRARSAPPGKDGEDSQRVNRVIQACGTHCHVCFVWI